MPSHLVLKEFPSNVGVQETLGEGFGVLVFHWFVSLAATAAPWGLRFAQRLRLSRISTTFTTPIGTPPSAEGAFRRLRDSDAYDSPAANTSTCPQLSLTVGLIGIAVSFTLGVFFGALAGYVGGPIDWVIQRTIEILRSLPELPLWLALSAAVPSNWSPVAVFFAISVILGMFDWPGLARSVRAKFLSLREDEYVRAVEMMGATPGRVIRKHLIPNFASHLIASATLSIPAMILGETALSFLGLGLRAPAVSWGVMLNDAQNFASIEIYP